MKRILAIAVIYGLLTSFSFAEDNVSKRLRDTPELSEICKRKINYYSEMVNKYRAIPANRRKNIDNTKLNYFRMKLSDWTKWCFGPREESETD